MGADNNPERRPVQIGLSLKMIKIVGPLHSDQARKQLGHNIIYKRTKRRNLGTGYSKPGSKAPFNPSPDQLDKRMLFNLIIACWQSKTNNQRAAFDDEVKVKELKMSGWNLFYSKAMKDPYTYLGIAGYWSFNKIVNGKIPDLSGNGNDGDLKPTYPSDCPTLVDSFKPKFGKAGKFDGDNDYVNCGSHPSLDIVDAITIGAWVKLTDPAPSQHECLVNLGAADSRISFFTRRNTVDNLFSYWDKNNGWKESTFSLSREEWYHLVWVGKSADYMKFYVNGDFINERSLANSFPTLDGSAKIAWSGYSTDYIQSKIDEVRIYNRALSQTEIQKLYNLKFT